MSANLENGTHGHGRQSIKEGWQMPVCVSRIRSTMGSIATHCGYDVRIVLFNVKVSRDGTKVSRDGTALNEAWRMVA
jgi:hypothetical protein